LADSIAGGHTGLSDQEKSAIREQTARLLANAHFSQSRRFPPFLRYVIEKTLANDAEMNHLSVVDSNAPATSRWTVDRTQQMATNNYRDYAIVARFTDGNTGRVAVVAAGVVEAAPSLPGNSLPTLPILPSWREPPRLHSARRTWRSC
jgi:hypothetical protein